MWVVALVVIFMSGAAIGSGFSADNETPDSDSADGFDVLDRYFGGVGAGLTGSIVFQTEAGVDDPVVVAAMSEMFSAVDELEGVDVAGPYNGSEEGRINDDRTIGFATVFLADEIDQEEASAVGEEIVDLIPDVEGLRVEIGGDALGPFEPPESELIGIAFAVVVLILAFGSVLAMGLPIAVALFGVGSGIGLVVLISNIQTAPEFSTTLAAMIGLGVGIDYALFIVTRYREGVHRGSAPAQAMEEAMDTAGRAVIFAGSTVVVSLMGMLLIGLQFITGLAIAASTTVLMTMLASVTLLPALISLAGPRIELTRWRGLIAAGLVSIALLGVGLGIQPLMIGAPLAVIVLLAGFAVAPLKRRVPQRRRRPVRETIPYRWSRFVQSRPWTVAGAATLVLVTMTLPVFGLRFGFSDEGNWPEDTTTRQAYDLLAEGFGPGFNGPLILTAETLDGDGRDHTVVPTLIEALRATRGVDSVTEPVGNDPDDPVAFTFRLVPETAPQDEATADLVRDLRDEVIPAAVAGSTLDVNVTGIVALGVDFSDYLGGRTVLFFTAVLAVSFVLLMVVFRSLLVPLKAVIMNLLSISAAYGFVVVIFQWGWFGDITQLEPAPIEPFIPMMMFAIVFGLSMDYEVFLLSRVKEEYDRTGDAVNSVADGLASTARVISAAAAIMVVVFGSFMLEENRIVQLFGMGLGIAVLLDATLVRMLLVPATMELLGDRNWWLPSRLDRILPRVRLEGARTPAGFGPEPELVGAER
jgi:RND superfamily putative drug exporter